VELEASVLSSHLCCRVLSPVSSSQFCLHSPILSPRLSPVSSVFYVTSLCQLSRSDHHHLRPPSPATTITCDHHHLRPPSSSFIVSYPYTTSPHLYIFSLISHFSLRVHFSLQMLTFSFILFEVLPPSPVMAENQIIRDGTIFPRRPARDRLSNPVPQLLFCLPCIQRSLEYWLLRAPDWFLATL
jgi:hypothetical protein